MKQDSNITSKTGITATTNLEAMLDGLLIEDPDLEFNNYTGKK